MVHVQTLKYIYNSTSIHTVICTISPAFGLIESEGAVQPLISWSEADKSDQIIRTWQVFRLPLSSSSKN